MEWVWPKLNIDDFRSKGDGSIIIVPEFINMVNELQDLFGQRLPINCIYRDPIHNAKEGGAPKSLHKYGKAGDFSVRNLNRFHLLDCAKEVGFTGFGYYKTFLHLDIGPKRFWYGGKGSQEAWKS